MAGRLPLPLLRPGPQPAEGVWSHLKHSLANHAPCTIGELSALTHPYSPQGLQYRPGVLDGYIAETGLMPTPP